jgi:putative transposase
MRNVRQLTKSINPKAHAAWTLPALYSRLMEYAYEVYDGNAHPALGQTPAEVFAAGLERGGERLRRRVAYDDGFKMLTLPTTARGVAKVQPGSGVKINYIYYWTAELGSPEVEKSLLPVRYDPFDLSTTYVFVLGHWTKCVSAHWPAFRAGRSASLCSPAPSSIVKTRIKRAESGRSPLNG